MQLRVLRKSIGVQPAKPCTLKIFLWFWLAMVLASARRFGLFPFEAQSELHRALEEAN